MLADAKWDQATAALAAFAQDPATAGLGLGIQFFPLGSSCDVDKYALPAVPMAPLPANSTKIQAALAKQTPDGDTPTWPALRGGVEYARALRLAEPSQDVIVALVTDGAPNACGSTTDSVAQLAAEAATTEPQVLTFVIGLAVGYVEDMQRIAKAGGTGAPILIHDTTMSAQELVAALNFVRETQLQCRYAIPSVDTDELEPTDIGVSYRLDPGDAPTELPLVSGPGDCGMAGGFYVDDPALPRAVTLCTSTCETLHTRPAAKVTVVAGCGTGVPPGQPPPTGSPCDGTIEFQCVHACGDPTSTLPTCVEGEYRCPAGTVSNVACTVCPAVPHGCCKSDGTLADAACVGGAWICPPGAQIFGTPGCSPPDVCAPLLPCASGQYCKVPDFTCGSGNVPGTCAPIPAGCSDPGPPACGCDGATYTSPCAASAAGIDLSTESGCAGPAGTYPCGPLFCRTADQVCKKTLDLTKVIAPESFACIAPACPTGCGCNACEPCPGGLTCTESCTSDGQNHFLTCTAF